MKPFTRADRISVQIQSNLSDLLRKKVSDPRLEMVTITGVRLADDLRHAEIFFCVIGEKKARYEAKTAFRLATGFLKKNLAGTLGLKFMPNLSFIYDESFDYGSRIDSVLKTLDIPQDSDDDSDEASDDE